jgi:hypothetical protein
LGEALSGPLSWIAWRRREYSSQNSRWEAAF